MQELITATLSSAHRLFPYFTATIWTVKTGQRWRGFLINTKNKTILAKGKLAGSQEQAIGFVKKQIEDIVGKG